ncbi:MAG: Gfo/Idh/MocA family oxidoreductase [Victivallaceae bacterium]|nr:Gfo/Idh/MocA family oxidoreductase [Victivallaceae bacterium]
MTIRIGIVGCGVIAPSHLLSYSHIPGIEVVALADLQLDKAEKLAGEYHVPKVYASGAELFADPDIDAVSICTDHGSHSALAIEALRRGKHVLVEKPLASSVPELDAMLAEGKKHPELVFSGVLQHRFDPVYKLARRLIAEGILGRLLNVSLIMQCRRDAAYYAAAPWRGKWSTEGGSVLMNQTIHFIDLLAYLAGDFAQITGFFDNLAHQGVIETEDVASAALKFQNGALGTVLVTSASFRDWEMTLGFHGTTGSLELRDGKLLQFDCADKTRMENVQHSFAALADDEAKLRAGKAYYGAGHDAQLADFVAAIRDRRLPFVPAEEAAKTVRILQHLLKRA